MAAVKRAVLEEPEIGNLLEIGPFPDGYDYARGVDLLRRGLAELQLVDLA